MRPVNISTILDLSKIVIMIMITIIMTMITIQMVAIFNNL